MALALCPQQGMLTSLKIICTVMHCNALAEEAYRDVKRAYHCQSIIVLWEAGLDRFEIQKGPLNITVTVGRDQRITCMLFAMRPEYGTSFDEASRANAALIKVLPTPVFAPQTMNVGSARLTCSDLASDRSELNALTWLLRSLALIKSDCNSLL